MDFAEKKRKVDYLLRRKFPGSWAPPPLTPVGRGSLADREVGRFNVERHTELMERIEVERRRLNLLPSDALENLYADAVAEDKNKEVLRLRLEETGRFFNKREAEADFTYWSKIEYWTLDESLALLLGKSPEVVTWKTVQPYVNISEFAKQYERLRNLALRAQAMSCGQAATYPGNVLAWAEDMDIAVPQGLKDAIAERAARRRTTAANRDEAKRQQAMLLGDGVLEAFSEKTIRVASPFAQVPPSQEPPPSESPMLAENDRPLEMEEPGTEASPGNVEPDTLAVVTHALTARRDVLDPVIDMAEKASTNADDRTAVWNSLTALALANDRPHPLLGVAERSVKYLDGDDVKFLNRDAFNKRWGRRKDKAAANRR